MDTPEPIAATQSQTPLEEAPSEAPARTAPSDTRRPILIFIGIVVVVAVVLVLTLLSRASSPTNPLAIPTPTTTPIAASPTPLRELSPIATSSAFLDLSGQIASLSAHISRINLSDQSLTPPVVELPLGFSN